MTLRNTRLCLAAVIVALMPVVAMMLMVDGPIAAGTTQTLLPQADPTATETYTAYLPLVRNDKGVPAPLVNGGFELDWSVESSHRALRFNTDGSVDDVLVDNIQTPPGWITWFRHGEPTEPDPNNPEGWFWNQPEVRLTRKTQPDRMHSGKYGLQLFTVMRLHDAGFLQQVNVTPGELVRLGGWSHAWSYNGGVTETELLAYWSEGSHVGFNHFFALEGTEGLDGGDRNFTFLLGIDPYGGLDPYADTVVWGQGAHIYNAFHQVPSVITTSQSPTVTVFLRSRTLLRWRTNDAYWDDITLEVLKQ